MKQWADQFAAARARTPTDLSIAVAANAVLGANIARAEIGTLQPSLTISDPLPVYFPAWAPLADATIADKAGMGFGPPEYEPLRRTGQLEASIEGVAEGLTGAVVSNDQVMVYHEFGTPKMPPRVVLARAVAITQPIFAKELAKIAVSLLKPVR